MGPCTPPINLQRFVGQELRPTTRSYAVKRQVKATYEMIGRLQGAEENRKLEYIEV